MGKAFIVVGGTGTGKTTWIKDRLKNVNKKSLFIHDVNNEYQEFHDRKLMSVQDFTDLASKLQNAVIVFEEATIFFRNRGQDEQMLNILVRKRHTNNTIFLVFHSLRAVPKYIYELINYIVIFKTNDSPKLIETKFEVPELYESFQRVKQNKTKFYHEIFETSGNVMHT